MILNRRTLDLECCWSSLAQKPNSCSLPVLGLEPSTYRSVAQSLNCFATCTAALQITIQTYSLINRHITEPCNTTQHSNGCRFYNMWCTAIHYNKNTAANLHSRGRKAETDLKSARS